MLHGVCCGVTFITGAFYDINLIFMQWLITLVCINKVVPHQAVVNTKIRVATCHLSRFRRDVPFFSLFVPCPGGTFAGTLYVPFFELQRFSS